MIMAIPSKRRLIPTNEPTSHTELKGQPIKNTAARRKDSIPFASIQTQPLMGLNSSPSITPPKPSKKKYMISNNPTAATPVTG